MKTIIGQTQVQSTAYNWRKKAQIANPDVTVTVTRTVEDGETWYVVSRESTPDEIAAVEEESDRRAYEATEGPLANDEAAFVEYPPRPVGLVIGGTPMTDEEREAIGKIRQLETAIANMAVKLAKHERDLAYRTSDKHKHQYGLRAVATTETLVRDAKEAIGLWERELAEVEAKRDDLKAIRSEQDAAANKALELYVTDRFRSHNDLLLRSRGNGAFDLHLLTGKVIEYTDKATGERLAYPETRFGYSATVYGPQRGYSFAGESEPDKGAYVGWGSMSMPTLAHSRDMLRLFALSIEVAELVNALYGIDR